VESYTATLGLNEIRLIETEAFGERRRVESEAVERVMFEDNVFRNRLLPDLGRNKGNVFGMHRATEFRRVSDDTSAPWFSYWATLRH
jgi:hypothetical protein